MDDTSVEALCSCLSFLCCDWLWLPAGSESGRSSPYYGQEGRSTTPTTIQPPKHFHVPGRTPHLLIALLMILYSHGFCNSLGKNLSLLIQSFRKVILSFIGIRKCKLYMFYATYNCFDIFFPHTSPLIPFQSLLRSNHPNINSHPFLLYSFTFQLSISSFSPQPQGTPASTGSLPSIGERVQCS